MLAIVVTHPIQYHVPLWRRLAQNNRLPFEVWYLSEHAARMSRDKEFGKDFSWDLEMFGGYPHRFIETPRGATPNTPFKLRSAKPFVRFFDAHKVSHVWVLGWQVAAYWQAVRAGHKSGREVWLRGESNALRQQGARSIGPGALKEAVKRIVLGQLFRRVDHFLCIGTANRELYRSYDVPEQKLHMALYAVDNERFARQADAIRGRRSEIRRQWGIPDDAFCVLFCGKFVPKKRPMDLIEATRLLITDNSITDNRARNAHLLFVGSGELGGDMRAACNVVFDAESNLISDRRPVTAGMKPPASFAGFLNQTAISAAYVAADVLVLPSDYGETWGLVVNEANASGLGAIISDRCGCAPDLGTNAGNSTFVCGNAEDLRRALLQRAGGQKLISDPPPSMEVAADLIEELYLRKCE